MAGVNTQGRFSLGRDVTVVLIGPYGRIDLPNVMQFDAKQETATVKVDRLDGVQMLAELEKGWTGSLEIERGNADIDALFAQKEADWFGNGVTRTSVLYQYVVEPNGSTSTFQYDNVVLKLADSGTWKGDASVRQKIDFMANRRRMI